MSVFEAATVLTTEERSDWFKAVFGLGAHYVYDPAETAPLGSYLSNLRIGGGSLAVLDEAHFLSADMLLMGVKDYVDNAVNAGGNLRLIVVCPGRRPGDRLLAYLTMYCHIFDIVCAEDYIDLIGELEHLAQTPNKRQDVLVYMEPSIQAQRDIEPAVIGRSEHAQEQQAVFEIPVGMRVRLVIEPVGI